MVGRPVELAVKKEEAKPEEVVLDVKNLTIIDKNQKVEVNDISFEVRAGEILGVAGVQGNGQTELVRCLTGLMKADSGEVTILGKDVTNSSPRKITELGVAHIPEDRQKDDLILQSPIKDNLVLNTYYKAPFARGIVRQPKTVSKNAKDLVSKFDIRTPGISVQA